MREICYVAALWLLAVHAILPGPGMAFWPVETDDQLIN
jgi:hypothetical protein